MKHWQSCIPIYSKKRVKKGIQEIREQCIYMLTREAILQEYVDDVMLISIVFSPLTIQ